MGKSVIICKITYYHPGDKERSSNRCHVEYIALKPEADRGDESALQVGDKDYRLEADTAAGHVQYAAERAGSSGLFGPEDEQPPEWQEIARELGRHELPTWRVIVSLREDDAVRLGFTERDSWETAIRTGVENAAKAMHLDPDHLRWVAAFHQKAGHPHCHVVIWERPHAAARRRGLLEDGERKGIWRAFARELFRAERTRLGAEKTAIRDAIRDLAQGEVASATRLVSEIRTTATWEVQALEGGHLGVPPVLREDVQVELSRRLAELAQAMPGQGRVALAYMPHPVQEQAREIAGWLLNRPGFVSSAERFCALG